jgi:hypothetical protein
MDQVVINDYNVAKDVLGREELADRPQWCYFHFYMKYNNAGRASSSPVQSIRTTCVCNFDM